MEGSLLPSWAGKLAPAPPLRPVLYERIFVASDQTLSPTISYFVEGDNTSPISQINGIVIDNNLSDRVGVTFISSWEITRALPYVGQYNVEVTVLYLAYSPSTTGELTDLTATGEAGFLVNGVPLLRQDNLWTRHEITTDSPGQLVLNYTGMATANDDKIHCDFRLHMLSITPKGLSCFHLFDITVRLE